MHALSTAEPSTAPLKLPTERAVLRRAGQLKRTVRRAKRAGVTQPAKTPERLAMEREERTDLVKALVLTALLFANLYVWLPQTLIG